MSLGPVALFAGYTGIELALVFMESGLRLNVLDGDPLKSCAAVILFTIGVAIFILSIKVVKEACR